MSFSLALLSADEEHSISHIFPVANVTGIPGPCGTVFMAEETSGYFTYFLFFRFIPKMKINTSTMATLRDTNCGSLMFC